MIQLSFLFIISGCAYSIHDVYISDFQPYMPVEKGQIIKAESEQFVVMSFVQNTDYVDQAYEKLQKQCASKTITGISTQISTSLGFFSWTNKALMQGLCVASKN
jgi:hypothetical protein